METRDRLIELIKNARKNTKGANCDIERNMLFADHLLANGVVVLDTGVISPKNRPLITHFADMPINDVLDLVRAKREGRIIVPPCKVGQTVYYIAFGKVYKGKCHAITLKHTLQIHLYDFDGDNASYPASKVFLTKEEAEKALKECEGNGDERN
ncbi:MAG: hypothetical protein IKM48_03225 [Clostridia bacterium]|nr:hypothetical protein [Clostridia bacterium]